MNILHIESSIFTNDGVSSQLSRVLIEQLTQSNHHSQVKSRQLGAESIPHFDGQVLTALSTAPEQRSEQQQALADFADQQIEAVQWADILVLGMPMYNFGVPSALKAWLDYLARAGVTFRYTESGPEGLLKNKTAYIVTTRGGRYKNSDADSQVPFIKTFLAFLGIEDVHIIYAEGLNLGEGERQQAIDQAKNEIATIVTA